MRRPFLIVLLVLAVVLVFSAVGCGDDAPAKSSKVQVSPDDPRGLAKAVFDATADLNSFTCTLDTDIQLTLDPSSMSSEDSSYLSMFAGPIKVSGTMAIDAAKYALQMDLNFGMAGLTYNMGLRVLDEKTWISMLGRWYDISEVLDDSDNAADDDLDFDVVLQKMTALDAEPADWLGRIQPVKEETLDTTPVYHLTCSPDLYELLTDVITLMDNDDFMKYVDPAGDLAGSDSSSGVGIGDIRNLRDTLDQLVTRCTLDVQAGKQDQVLRQLNTILHMQPSVGQSTDGLRSIDVALEIKLDNLDKPVVVEAPKDFLPYSAFEKMFGSGSGSSPFPFLNTPVTDEPTKS